jgi:hypothetical protein
MSAWSLSDFTHIIQRHTCNHYWRSKLAVLVVMSCITSNILKWLRPSTCWSLSRFQIMMFTGDRLALCGGCSSAGIGDGAGGSVNVAFSNTLNMNPATPVQSQSKSKRLRAVCGLEQCFSTFVRPRPGKFFFYKTRARGPTIVLVNNFPVFLSSYIKLAQVLIP